VTTLAVRRSGNVIFRFHAQESNGLTHLKRVQQQGHSCRKYPLENNPRIALCNVADPAARNVSQIPALSSANCLSPALLAKTLAQIPESQA
jgi:hypothetical protein